MTEPPKDHPIAMESLWANELKYLFRVYDWAVLSDWEPLLEEDIPPPVPPVANWADKLPAGMRINSNAINTVFRTCFLSF